MHHLIVALLGVDEIRELLAELGRRLHDRGVEATIYIVGGAAIALEMDARRVTVDVDAVFRPETTVAETAAAIAAERGLRPDWLNQSARAYIPGGDAGAVLPGRDELLLTGQAILNRLRRRT